MKRFIRITALLVAGLSYYLPTQAQTLDPSFAAVDIEKTGVIDDAQLQADGKYVVGGTFTRINGTAATGLARLNADGTLDAAFTSTVASLRPIEKVRQLPNGQLLVFAYLVQVGGRTFNTVAKLNADGTVATDFSVGSGTTASIRSVALQPDGKILLSGSFFTFNGVKSPGLVRLNANGSVDQAFSTALGNGFVWGGSTNVQMGAVVLQPDGKILVGGYFENYNNTGRSSFVRLNTDGTLDTTFNPVLLTSSTYPTPFIYSLALDPRTNNIVVYGSRFALNNRDFVRLLPSGQLDNTFTSSAYPACNNTLDNEALVVDSQGRVTYRGCFTGTNAVSGNDYLFRMLPTGQIDTQFAVQRQLNGEINSLRVLPDGSLLIGGEFQRYGTLRNVCLLRLNDQAQPITTFRPAVTQPGTIAAMKVQPDGKVLVGGNFWVANGQNVGNLARFNTDGTLDATFRGTGANAEVSQLLVQPNGRIVVGGSFTTVDERASALVGRLLTDGTADASFTTTASYTASLSSPPVLALAQLPDGSLLVGGGATTFNNIAATLHRLSAAGVADASYNTALAGGAAYSGTAPMVYDLAVLADGKHYVAGYFNQFGGSATSGVARLNATGSRDNTFVATLSENLVPRVLPLPNGQLMIGNVRLNGQYGSVGRLTSTGALDATYTTGLTSLGISTLSLLPNGRILVAGSSIGAGNFGPVALLSSSGALVTSFNTRNVLSPSDCYVSTLAVQPDGALLVAGNFTQAGGTLRPTLARLTSPAILTVANQQLAARTQAWPVPAHSALHLRLDASAQPRSLELLDATGRVVLTQVVRDAEPVLPVRQLRAGLYLLRVNYADGPVTRRVVVE